MTATKTGEPKQLRYLSAGRTSRRLALANVPARAGRTHSRIDARGVSMLVFVALGVLATAALVASS